MGMKKTGVHGAARPCTELALLAASAVQTWRAHADGSAAKAGARAQLTRAARQQVLLSQDAWEHLQGAMPAAGFPTIEQLGLFRLAAWPAPIWLYQARPRPLPCDPRRRAAPVAGAVMLGPPSAAPRRKCAARCSGRKRATRCGLGASAA